MFRLEFVSQTFCQETPEFGGHGAMSEPHWREVSEKANVVQSPLHLRKFKGMGGKHIDVGFFGGICATSGIVAYICFQRRSS